MASLEDFLEKYGEKGYIVLKAILEEASRPSTRPRPGDFSFKGIKSRISSYGIEYNPSLLLAKLEREYGVIETSFKSSNQHWWRIRDKRELARVVKLYEGVEEEASEDPRVRVLRIQLWSLEPEKILKTLHRIASSPRPGYRERGELRRIAFEVLPLVAKFVEEASEYGDELSDEISIAEEILEAAERAIARLSQGRGAREAWLEAPSKGGLREPF